MSNSTTLSSADIKKLKESPLDFMAKLTKPKLKKVIKALNDAYYNSGNTIVSDEIYDIIIEKYGDSVEDVVGANPQSNSKVALPVYMGSLGKIKADAKTLTTFLNKYETSFYISEKLDGVSALLHKGQLYTRGNGEVGTDISKLIGVIKGFNKEHMSIKEYSVRGEIIMAKEDFKDSFGKNRRNVVSGLVNAKRINKDVASNVIFIAYDMIDNNGNTVEDSLEKLDKAKFVTPNYISMSKNKINVASLSDYLKKRRSISKYDIDGIVIKSNAMHKILKDKNPKFAIAFKHLVNQEISETIVTDVIWKVSKDGLVKPTVTFNTVNIDGVNISQATGFNGKYIYDNKVGPGAVVLIKRAGDVIPHIEKIIKSSDRPKMPVDITFKWSESGVDIISEGTVISSDQLNAVLLNFFKSLGVNGVGPSLTDKMRVAGFTTPKLVMNMSEKDFVGIDGFANKGELYQQINAKIKEADCITMMNALNVFSGGIGVKKIKVIIDGINGGYKNMYNVSMSELITISGVSNITAEKFLKGVADFKTYGIKCVTVDDDVKARKGDELSGSKKTGKMGDVKQVGVVVFTGVRNKSLEEKLDNIGVVTKTSFSKKDAAVKRFLIVKDIESKSSKMQNAIKDNIRIIQHDTIENLSEKHLIEFLNI